MPGRTHRRRECSCCPNAHAEGRFSRRGSIFLSSSGVVFDVVPNAVSTIDFLRNNQLRSAAVETLFW
jgi:hypothetical protein